MIFAERIRAIKIEVEDHRQCHGNTHMLERHLVELEREIRELLARLGVAVRIHVTAHVEGATMADQQFAAGATITLNAAPANAEGQQVPDNLTWTTTSGTLVSEDPSTLSISLVNAAIGTVTVTASDDNGISGSVTFDVVDNVVSSITVTAS